MKSLLRDPAVLMTIIAAALVSQSGEGRLARLRPSQGFASATAEPKAFAVHWASMPRKLKVYQTSQGFYDLAVAAPSMKAAAEAWGANMNLFHQGFAREADDSDVIAAAMAKPGVVLRRPVGSNKPFGEHADLPTAASLDLPRPKKAKAPKARNTDETYAAAAFEKESAAAFEKERLRREKQREKEEAAAAKARERRHAAIEKAEAALDQAKREHEENATAIEADLAAVQHRLEAEKKRWDELKERLEEELRKASRS